MLEATAKGGVDQRLQKMTTIIISLAVERFEAVAKKPARTPFTKEKQRSTRSSKR